MTRILLFVAIAIHSLPSAATGQSPSVQSRGGRYTVHCQSAPLESVIREIAGIAKMELWLDEGLADKKVTVSIESATLKEALKEVFEDVKVNYVLYSDPGNPERVTKLYAGVGGTGRLGRVPTVEGEQEPALPAGGQLGNGEPTEALPPELDPESLLESPDAQEALGALKALFEQSRSGNGDDSADSESQASEDGSSEAPDVSIPPALRDLFEQIPTPPPAPQEPEQNQQQKKKKNDPQL